MERERREKRDKEKVKGGVGAAEGERRHLGGGQEEKGERAHLLAHVVDEIADRHSVERLEDVRVRRVVDYDRVLHVAAEAGEVLGFGGLGSVGSAHCEQSLGAASCLERELCRGTEPPAAHGALRSPDHMRADRALCAAGDLCDAPMT